MGTLTLDVFKTELGFLLSNRNDADATNSTRLERWINQGYVYLCHPDVHPFRQMQSIENITLATGDNTYEVATLSSNTVVSVRWVSYVDATTYSNTANQRPVRQRDIRVFERRTLTTGPPTEWARDGTTLFISAVPGSNENGKILRVGYWQEPDILTGTNATVLPSYFDRPILKFAQGFAEDDLGERELSMLTLKVATALANNAGSEDQLEAEDWDFQVNIPSQPVM